MSFISSWGSGGGYGGVYPAFRIEDIAISGISRIEKINNLDLFGNAKIIDPKPDKMPQKWADNSSTMPSNWQEEVKKDTDWRRNYYD